MKKETKVLLALGLIAIIVTGVVIYFSEREMKQKGYYFDDEFEGESIDDEDDYDALMQSLPED